MLNLYDTQTGGLGPADVTLARGRPPARSRGSLVVNAAGDGLTFVATGGLLPADTYTVVLRSAANGFRDTLAGAAPDGNGDGTAGDDYAHLHRDSSRPGVVEHPRLHARSRPAGQRAGRRQPASRCG